MKWYGVKKKMNWELKMQFSLSSITHLSESQHFQTPNEQFIDENTLVILIRFVISQEEFKTSL